MAHPEEALIKLFGSTSRARILALLFSDCGQARYQREIVYETGLSLQAVQRELANLWRLGIVEKHAANSRVYYHLNSASPLFKSLKEIYRVIQG